MARPQFVMRRSHPVADDRPAEPAEHGKNLPVELSASRRLTTALIQLVPGPVLPRLNHAWVFALSHWMWVCGRPRSRLKLTSADPVGDAAKSMIAVRGPAAIGIPARLAARDLRETAFARGDPASAVGELLSLLRLHPRDELLQRVLARVLEEIGEHDKAVAAWQGIVERFPGSRE